MKIEFGDLLILIDRQHCRFLTLNPNTQHRHLYLLHEFNGDKSMGHLLPRDKPGRTHSRATGGNTAYEQHDARSLSEHRFLVDVASQIRDQWKKGGFNRIVLVGNPEVLIELKSVLDPNLLSKVFAEIYKNYINKTVGELDPLFNHI